MSYVIKFAYFVSFRTKKRAIHEESKVIERCQVAEASVLLNMPPGVDVWVFDYSQCRILDIGQRRVVLEDKKHKKERFGHKERFVHLIKRFVHLTNVTNA
jgi:hypothetical protein